MSGESSPVRQHTEEADFFFRLIEELAALDPETRGRILKALCAWFKEDI